MRYDVFISYSSVDQKIAEGVCAYLEQLGIRCFVAYRDIPRGVVWATAIVKALEQSRMMVVLFSKHFNDSTQVEREIELASDMQLPLLTFRLSNDAFRGAKKYYLQNLNWIDAFPNPERNFGALYRNVASLLEITDKEVVKKNPQPQSGSISHSRHYLRICIICIFIVLLVDLIFLAPRFVSVDNLNFEQAEISFNQGLNEFDNENYSEAVKWFKKSAEQGNAGAQFHLGNCYKHGVGVSKDSLEAIKWFRKSAEQGDDFAQTYLGKYYYFDGGDTLEAVKWFKKSAKQGNAEAQYYLGNCYYEGIGVSKDALEAIIWYKKSAEQGNKNAQVCLGVFFYFGDDVVPKDSLEAVKWFKESARQGNAEAQFYLGNCYYVGIGVTKDMVKAVTYYKEAAEQGHADAQCSLGVCYEYGYGVQKDLFKAVIWFKKSAEQGNSVAQYNLGHSYEYGNGVTKDLFQAVKWYQKAADQDLEEAKEALKRFENKILGPIKGFNCGSVK